MAIRITCDKKGYEDCWVEFRSDRWTFKDRRTLTETTSDEEVFNIVLSYITDWHLLDVDHELIPFDPSGGLSLLDNLDDTVMTTWLITAWWEARREVGKLKNST